LDHHLISWSWRYGPNTCLLGHIYSRRYKSPSTVESCYVRAMWWRSNHPFFLMTSYLFISFFWNVIQLVAFHAPLNLIPLAFWAPIVQCILNIKICLLPTTYLGILFKSRFEPCSSTRLRLNNLEVGTWEICLNLNKLHFKL